MGKVNRFAENKLHLMIVLIPFSPQNKKRPNGRFGGEKGIRTPGTVITVHMISNHAPSAISDISPDNAKYYNKYLLKNQVHIYYF